MVNQKLEALEEELRKKVVAKAEVRAGAMNSITMESVGFDDSAWNEYYFFAA